MLITKFLKPLQDKYFTLFNKLTIRLYKGDITGCDRKINLFFHKKQ